MTRRATAWDAAVVNERNVMSKSPAADHITLTQQDTEKGLPRPVFPERRDEGVPAPSRFANRLPAATAAPRKTRIADIFTDAGRRAFISLQLAIVLAVIAGATALIAYEWHAAHATAHHSSAASGSHHHKHKHEPHTAGNY